MANENGNSSNQSGGNSRQVITEVRIEKGALVGTSLSNSQPLPPSSQTTTPTPSASTQSSTTSQTSSND